MDFFLLNICVLWLSFHKTNIWTQNKNVREKKKSIFFKIQWNFLNKSLPLTNKFIFHRQSTLPYCTAVNIGDIMWCDVMCYDFMLCYVTLRYVTLRYVTLRYVTCMLRYVTLRTLRYVTLRYYAEKHRASSPFPCMCSYPGYSSCCHNVSRVHLYWDLQTHRRSCKQSTCCNRCRKWRKSRTLSNQYLKQNSSCSYIRVVPTPGGPLGTLSHEFP